MGKNENSTDEIQFVRCPLADGTCRVSSDGRLLGCTDLSRKNSVINGKPIKIGLCLSGIDTRHNPGLLPECRFN